MRDREFQALLSFARERQPGLEEIPGSDRRYWNEQYRRAHYAFDAQSVRPYFPYEAVQRGVLDAASRFFGVQFRPVKDARPWHPSVTTLDVVDRGHRIGRVYLDMHPREGKDKWFSSQTVAPGIRGRQLPEGALVCNFSGGVPGDPGLMEYHEVVTFFHEFGHLMHHVLGGQNRWSGQGGFNVEGDFLEAPSQMLEEFFTSYRVLARFARHYQTGAVVPEELVNRMNAADAFGRGTTWQRQLFLALYLLEMHNQAPDRIDLDEQLRALQRRFTPYAFVDGDHMYASWWHVSNEPNYYTYVLDKVIALDFYSQFNRSDPMAGPAALHYRRAVIEPGATKPAAQLVRDFLGRPQSMDAFKAWLDEEFR